MTIEPSAWPSESICISHSSLDAKLIAADIYRRTCRVNFKSPGFCVVNAGNKIDSVSCRQLMLDLKLEMAAIHQSKTGNTLSYLSVGRFDQQQTTRPHLDGGPDESLLMLGYEPSAIDSEIEIFDYAKCAFDLGLSPKAFMDRHNPMFKSGCEILRPYRTRITCLSQTDYQIICINNSSSPYSESRPTWQGVLHTATILKPDESKRRIINSTLIASAAADTGDMVSDEALDDFVSTCLIHRKTYSKPPLEDEA